MPERAAWMDAVPCVNAEARPDGAMLATAGFEDVQVTLEVSDCVVPSEYVPVAVNCWERPFAMDAVPGATAMESSAAGLTVSEAIAEIYPCAAEIEAAPCAKPVANPEELTEAAPAFEVAQVTELVRFCVEPSV